MSVIIGAPIISAGTSYDELLNELHGSGATPAPSNFKYVEVNPLNVNQNGTYNAPANNAYDPVGVSVPTGGTQPTLYPPLITGGVNIVSWSNNPSNGDFAVTLSADVDGTPVTSPLTITEQMDGSTLTITASAPNFESISSTIVLNYIASGNSVLAVGVESAIGDKYEVVRIGSYDNTKNKFVFDGVSASGCIWISANGVTENKTISASFGVMPVQDLARFDFSWYSGLYSPQGNDMFGFIRGGSFPFLHRGTWSNKWTVTITIHDVENNIDICTETITTNSYGGPSSTTFGPGYTGALKANKVYTLMINATLTPRS